MVSISKRRGVRARSMPNRHASSEKSFIGHVEAPRRMDPARGSYATTHLLTLYCLEPVVPLFGFGEQFRFCGFASFSQAAILAYLQLSAPLADVLMQNGELPIV